MLEAVQYLHNGVMKQPATVQQRVADADGIKRYVYGDDTINDLPDCYPTQLRDLCRRMLQCDPSRRPSIREVVTVLEGMVTSSNNGGSVGAEVARLRTRVGELEGERDAAIAAKNAAIAAKNAAVAAKNAAVAAKNDAVAANAALQDRLDTAVAEKFEAFDERDAAVAAKNAVQRQVATLASQKAALERNNTALMNDKATLQREKTTWEREKASLQARVRGLEASSRKVEEVRAYRR